jgi:hypothetical protein
MDRQLTQITECMYVDDHDNVYFCVGDFIRHHRLPDDAGFRRVVSAGMKEIYPEILILEEQN